MQTADTVPGAYDCRPDSWNRLLSHAVTVLTLAERTFWGCSAVHAGEPIMAWNDEPIPTKGGSCQS